jgi:hypothetical protein
LTADRWKARSDGALHVFSFGVAFEGLREMPRRLTYAAAGGCIECDVFA